MDEPLRVTARTRAQSAYGVPVIQGRATGIATVGIFAVPAQTIEPSVKLLRVASSNS
ncbi:MAG: hypothetical protein H0V79_04875 [Actinobacteria bacterium]|nr:hypothetical protein [Actinomycetota bacterium]